MARPTDPMSSHSFNWCTKCGFILAAVEMPPVGATVGVVLVYTNATNPQYPMAVVRMGVSLKRFNDLVFVSNADGTIVPASAVVAWRPWSSLSRTAAPRRALELHGSRVAGEEAWLCPAVNQSWTRLVALLGDAALDLDGGSL